MIENELQFEMVKSWSYGNPKKNTYRNRFRIRLGNDWIMFYEAGNGFTFGIMERKESALCKKYGYAKSFSEMNKKIRQWKTS